MEIKAGDNVFFRRPNGVVSGSVVKVIGARLRVRTADGKEAWAQVSDVIRVIEGGESETPTQTSTNESDPARTDDARAVEVVGSTVLFRSMGGIEIPGSVIKHAGGKLHIVTQDGNGVWASSKDVVRVLAGSARTGSEVVLLGKNRKVGAREPVQIRPNDSLENRIPPAATADKQAEDEDSTVASEGEVRDRGSVTLQNLKGTLQSRAAVFRGTSGSPPAPPAPAATSTHQVATRPAAGTLAKVGAAVPATSAPSLTLASLDGGPSSTLFGGSLPKKDTSATGTEAPGTGELNSSPREQKASTAASSSPSRRPTRASESTLDVPKAPLTNGGDVANVFPPHQRNASFRTGAYSEAQAPSQYQRPSDMLSQESVGSRKPSDRPSQMADDWLFNSNQARDASLVSDGSKRLVNRAQRGDMLESHIFRETDERPTDAPWDAGRFDGRGDLGESEVTEGYEYSIETASVNPLHRPGLQVIEKGSADPNPLGSGTLTEEIRNIGTPGRKGALPPPAYSRQQMWQLEEGTAELPCPTSFGELQDASRLKRCLHAYWTHAILGAGVVFMIASACSGFAHAIESGHAGAALLSYDGGGPEPALEGPTNRSANLSGRPAALPSATPTQTVPSPLPSAPPTPHPTDMAAFPAAAEAHPLTPQYDRWGAVTAPFPTGAWWTNAMLDDGDYPIVPLPYAVSTGAAGLAISYSADRRDVNEPGRVVDGYVSDITMSSEPALDSAPSVVRHDLLSVTFQYRTKSAGDGDDDDDTQRGSVTIPIVKGAPFITLIYENAWPVLHPFLTFSRVTSLSQMDEIRGGSDDSDTPVSCDAQDICAALGMGGKCCPDWSGTELECCRTTTQPRDDEFFFLETVTGQRWLLAGDFRGVVAKWSPSVITLQSADGGATSSPPARLVVRLALVTDANAESALMAHARPFPTGGDVSWTGASSTAPLDFGTQDAFTLRFDWDVSSTHASSSLGGSDDDGEGDEEGLVMMALPHHLDAMALHSLGKDAAAKDVPLVDHVRFKCLKGTSLGLVQGASWVMGYVVGHLAWAAETPIDDSLAADTHGSSGGGGGGGSSAAVSSTEVIRAQLAYDLEHGPEGGLGEGTYTFGKRVARLARLALLAAQLGDGGGDGDDGGGGGVAAESLAAEALAALEAALVPWLEGRNPNALVYDATWGGVVSSEGLKDFMADFGMAWYNDHHFHFGYFLYAAAVAGHLDPPFLRHPGHRNAALALARDVVNPPESGRTAAAHSPLFPTTRHKDWFDGHSWASGLFSMGSGKSQESVSEAANAYYAAALLAQVLARQQSGGGGGGGVADLADPAVLLGETAKLAWALEVAAAKKYWQVMPDSDVYPAGFVASNRMVGNVGGLDAVARTWFGDQLEYVHCIQMLPFTPATEQLLGPEFVKEELPDLETRINSAEDQWKGFIFQNQAIVDPATAWRETVDLFGTHIDGTTTGARPDEGTSVSAALYWIATRPVLQN